jgi:hypothetical protein
MSEFAKKSAASASTPTAKGAPSFNLLAGGD